MNSRRVNEDTATRRCGRVMQVVHPHVTGGYRIYISHLQAAHREVLEQSLLHVLKTKMILHPITYSNGVTVSLLGAYLALCI